MDEIIKISKKVIISYVFSSLNFIFGYLVRLSATRILDPNKFGLAYSIIYTSSMLASLLDFGLRQSITYSYHEKKEKTKVLLAFFTLKSVIFLVFLFLIFILRDLFFLYFKINDNSLFFLFLLLFATTYLFQDMIIIYFLRIKPEILYLINFLKFLFILALFLFFTFLFGKNNVYFFLLSWIISFFILDFFLFIFLIRNIGLKFYFDKKLVKNLIKKGFFLSILSLSSYIMFYLDSFFVIYFFEHKYYGFYSLAYSLLNFPLFLFTTLASFLFPLTVKHKEKIRNYFKDLIELIIFVVLPFSFIFFLYSKEIVLVVFGKEYLFTSKILIIFSLFLIFYILKNYMSNILMGMKDLNFLIKVYLITLLINALLNSLGVFLENIFIIAISTGFAWSLLSFFLFKRNSKLLKISISKEIFYYFLKVLLVSILLLIFIGVLKRLLTVNIYLEFIIVAIFSLIFYLLISFFFKTIPKSFFYFLDLLKLKIKIKIKQ